MMDVLTLSPIFILIKDAVISLSAMTAAIVAIFGLRAWRNELKGKSEYKLAKDLLKSVYKVRDGFLHVRNPAIYSYEYPEIVEDDGSVKIDQSDKDYVYEKRWKILDEAFSELESFHLDAQVEWGALYNEKITAMRKCRSKLLLEIQNYLRNQKISVQDRLHVDTNIIYGDRIEINSFTSEINNAIDEFETWLRPHINNNLISNLWIKLCPKK